MKNALLILSLFVSLVSCTNNKRQEKPAERINSSSVPDTAEMTNNFYDNTETFPLALNELLIEGEIANPGKVDFSTLPLRSVIVKEDLPDSSGSDRFVGAYRYDGYSLFDILEKSILKKSNSGEFRPIIDLYVEIESESGDKVVFSWGEIYYPNNLHKIIIASRVSRIVPSKTKELWPLPEYSKIVAASDLLTSRNISNPVKITVKSIKKSFAVSQGMSPMYSPEITLYNEDKKLAVILPDDKQNKITFGTVFYGRGKGIHSTSPFTGVIVKEILKEYYPATVNNLKTGMLCMAGKDGYRCAVSYSELFNRNDQQEFLLIKTAPEEDGGLYRVFPASDFFSDRAIKSLNEVHFSAKGFDFTVPR